MAVSTLALILAGTKLGGKSIRSVSYADRRARMRLVEFGRSRPRTMPIPILQDLLLLAKGYPEGKYSGLTVAELANLRRRPGKRRKTRRGGA